MSTIFDKVKENLKNAANRERKMIQADVDPKAVTPQKTTRKKSNLLTI